MELENEMKYFELVRLIIKISCNMTKMTWNLKCVKYMQNKNKEWKFEWTLIK